VLTGASGVGNQDTNFTYYKPSNSNPLIPVGIPANSAWIKPSSGAWIGPPGGNEDGESGRYIYTYTFSLLNTNGVSISGEWSSDNGTVGLLNGQIIINSPGGIASTFKSLHQFFAPSNLFKVGVNELRFEVDNAYGPTGLYVSALILENNCGYDISPTSQSHSSNAETGTVTINASPKCSWTATSNTDWATITFGDSGEGNGAVTYSITANPSHKSREGTLTIAGQTFTITQEGIDCSYSITPTSQSHSSNTETGAVQVSASGDCPWTASSNINWTNIVSGGSGNGDGTVTYAIMENTGTTREGTLTIAGQTFTITQAGKQSDPPPDADLVCSTTDDELVFTKLKEFYAVSEIVEVDLVGCATSRFDRADLWVAISMPSGDLLFMTTNPFEPFSLTPQVFRKSVKNTLASYNLLTFELPPDLGGKYIFYTVYVKEGKNPITDGFLVLLSNIGIAETTLSNR
jgi:hypothetical protein